MYLYPHKYTSHTHYTPTYIYKHTGTHYWNLVMNKGLPKRAKIKYCPVKMLPMKTVKQMEKRIKSNRVTYLIADQ